MGALAGLVHFRGDAPPLATAEQMAARLARRGPDGHGAWAEGPAALAHRRRQLRTAPAAPQPLVDGDLVVLLDGWIYDHESLLHQVGRHEPLTDTEALLLAFRRWGADALHRLDGEFAFAVWDRRARVLTLGRDRLGVRPLHYAARTGRVAFASEVAGLLPLDWVSRDPALDRLAEYLSFGVVHAPRTLLRDVHQVPPGHVLLADADGVRTRPYWKIRYAPAGAARPREGELIAALQAHVDAAVRKRVPFGVPTGLFLSGGLGSSAIAAAARRSHLHLPGFTVSFAEDPHPEAPFAGRVAQLLGIEHHEVVVGSAQIASTFDAWVASLGQPVALGGGGLLRALSREARRTVRVALAGDGGEELFGGRMLDGLGRSVALARWFQRLPAPVRAALRHGPLASRARRWSVPLDRYVLQLGIGGANLFDAAGRGALLRDPALVRPGIRQEVLRPFYADLATDPVNTALHGFLRSSLVEASLARADRAAAASGLDVRFPLLDREVVQAAAAVPGASKLRRVGGSLHTRWPLRALLRGELPEVLVDRPKRGVPTLVGDWLHGPGRLFLEERVERLRRDPLGLWRPEAIGALRADVQRSNAAGNRLWALLVLDAWLTT
ncbi:MAG: asparagine synthase (glutamine-hydrolyzing) [Myxococcota bacterium]